MSHVSALPVAAPPGVVEATAEATQFALATLTTSFPGVWEHLDAADAVVGAVGLAAVGRVAFHAYRSGGWRALLGWGGRFPGCRRAPTHAA